MLRKTIYWGCIFIITFFFSACSSIKEDTGNYFSTPVQTQSLDEAIKSLSQHLLYNIEKDSENKYWKIPPRIVLLNPFTDADGMEIEVHKKINQIIKNTANTNFKTVLHIGSMKNDDRGHYIINGSIKIALHPKLNKKLYKITATATKISSDQVIATSIIWLTNQYSVYRNKPVKLSKAIHLSNQYLLKKIRLDRKFKSHFRPVSIFLTPFNDKLKAKNIIAGEKIEQDLRKLILKKYNPAILDFSSQSGDYVIEGSISALQHPDSKKILYKLSSIAKDIRSGKVIALTEIWITNNKNINIDTRSESFDHVIAKVSTHLLKGITKDKIFHKRHSKINIAVQPFIDTKTKKKIITGQKIKNIIRNISQENYPNVFKLSTKKNSDYYIIGFVSKSKTKIKISINLKETHIEKLISTATATINKKEKEFKSKPIQFDLAAKKSSQHLLDNIKQYNLFNTNHSISHIVISPFLDIQSLDEVKASKVFANKMIHASKNKKDIKITMLKQHSLKRAHYAIQGYISLEKPAKKKEKKYRIRSVTREIATGKIIATTDTWIINKNLSYQRVAEYKDRPIYPLMIASQVQNRVKQLLKYKSASTLKRELSIDALLNEAGHFYANKQYQKALKIYRAVEKKKYHRNGLRIYAGLYLSYLRIGDKEKANIAFRKLIQWSIKVSNTLSMKFLFNVNSTSFAGNQFLQNQYKIWLKNIGQLFAKRKQCFNVVGHSSHTGSVAYNKQLSLQRAQSIINSMKAITPNSTRHLKAIGKGFSENISGLGTDDHRDAIDRRVEFAKGGC